MSTEATPYSEKPNAAATALPAARSRGRIEIDIAGARIRVESGVDHATLAMVLAAAGRQVISFRADLKIMLAAQPVDFRKSVHTLSALVSEALRADPYCGDVFIFRSKRSDRVKLLAWDDSGMVLVTKWLEEGRFTWPPIRDGVVSLTATQLSMLIDGLDWTRVTTKVVKRPAGVM